MSQLPQRIVSLTFEEPQFLGVIFDWPTGVIYEHQCGGTHCFHIDLQGYFVPVSRTELDDADRTSAHRFALDTDLLKGVFHDAYPDDDDACVWGRSTDDLPPDRVKRLEALVALLSYRGADYRQKTITLDLTRLDQGYEAAVPVMTPDGPGVLVWNNCD